VNRPTEPAGEPKKFNSANAGGAVPSLYVNYNNPNRTPNMPRDLMVSPSQPTADPAVRTVSSTQPSLSALHTDPDGGTIAGHWQLWSTSGLIRDAYKYAQSGSVVTVNLAEEGITLVEGARYAFRAATSDGITGTEWTPDFTFVVDTQCTPYGQYRVCGAIRAKYQEIGGPDSFLGNPITNEYDVPAGRQSDFQGGSIRWNRADGTTDYDAGPTAGAGTAGWFTTTDFALSDKLSAKVNVTSGNLHLALSGLAVPGIGADRNVGINFNSLTQVPGASDPGSGTLGFGWRLSTTPDHRLFTFKDGSVRLVDPSGRASLYRKALNGTFVPAAGAMGTTLTVEGAEYVLTQLQSKQVQRFRTSDGLLVSDTNRNGVATTFNYPAGSDRPSSITGTRGNGAPVTFTYDSGGRVATIDQNVDGTTRTLRTGFNAAGDQLTTVTDAENGGTVFGYIGRDLTSITVPGGARTTISYDTGHRVTRIVRDPDGGGVQATWTWDYTSQPGKTLLKAPNENADGTPEVTSYERDVFGKVSKVTDLRGNTQDVTFSPNNDVTQAVDALGGKREFGYDGFLPTSAKSPTGAQSTATYKGPQPYQPDTGTDSQGNMSSYGYDTRGNPISTSGGGVTSTATFNPAPGAAMACGGKPGQQCSATDGNSNRTDYTYDAGGNLTRTTPPAGPASLPAAIKATSYTYDGAGRTSTVTDGNAKVSTNVYDKLDRLRETTATPPTVR